MGQFVGRAAVCEVLNRALRSGEPELIAVYGRRRVGKTFLIREIFANRMFPTTIEGLEKAMRLLVK